MDLELVAIVMLLFLAILVSWAFLKGDPETHVKVLGMAFPMLGVVVGWLFQEGRIRDKEEQVVAAVVAEEAARVEAEQAVTAYADASQRLDDVERLLTEHEVPGNRIVLPDNSVRELEAMLENRPRFEASLADERTRSLREIDARSALERRRLETRTE
jgi:hypothetical protein